MSNLAKIAENIFIVCEKMSNDFGLPEAERENIIALRDQLPLADFYEVNKEIHSTIHEICSSEPSGPEFIPSVDSKPPSRLCVVAANWPTMLGATLIMEQKFKHFEHLESYLVFQYFEFNGQHIIFSVGGYFTKPWNEDGEHLFVIKEGHHLRDKIREMGVSDSKMAEGAISFTCKYFELINQPRLVKMQPAISRQSRRRMEKKYNIPATSWKRVEWDLSKPRYEPQDGKRGGWNMPLHYTRGHWRRAKEHWDKVVRRKDGECYKWIDGFWSGHPAFGIVRSVHAPKIGDADKAKEMVK